MVSTRDKITGTVFLVIGLLFIAFALRAEFVLRHISLFAFASVMSAILAVVAVDLFASARRRAERISQELAHASPRRRLWLPTRLYTYSSLLWQIRVAGSMVLFAAAMGAVAAFLAYRHGR
jgi:energy-converting hydrogenase Eha subunit A